ncbi:MAG TPA: hypothetical protein VFU32_01550 [Ktedonobacterales bacterium]|nr:hypothetical protein [Ktedonobacterales bacterium]
MISRRQFFRKEALEHYARSREKDILPRSVAPPVFLFFWILLGLLLAATLLAWQVQVPTYAAASGFIAQDRQPGTLPGGETQAVLFVPANLSPTLRVGQSLTLQVALTGQTLIGTITTIRPDVITPDGARQQYALTGDLALVITQLSVVVILDLGAVLPQGVFAGNSLIAQVQVGTRSVLSLLPDLLKGLVGD